MSKKTFTKPTQKRFVAVGKTMLYVLGSFIVSRGLKAAVPETHQKFAQATVAALGLGVAASTTNKELQLAGAGVAALQAADMTSKLAQDNLHLTKDTKINQIIKASLGMNGSKGLGEPYTAIEPSYSVWNSPTTIQPETIEQEVEYVN